MKVIVSGGTGFIGKALLEALLKDGHEVLALVRQGSSALNELSKVRKLIWDGKTLGDWAAALEGADALINLAGEPIAGKRWTTEQKAKLRSSRLDATNVLIEALRKTKKRPKVFINASAVGYYGHVMNNVLSENYERGHGFLAKLCEEWEKAAGAAEELGIRTVMIRIGIVLEKGGGALAKMLPPFQFFVGGPLGSGTQWFPWIHREDVTRIVLFILQNPEISGPVNVTAPQPATMREFCTVLGKVLSRPSWAPVPDFILQLLLGEMASMLVTGQRAVPHKLLDAGFQFKYPGLVGALTHILS